MLLMIDIP